jgi:hypothetical protein
LPSSSLPRRLAPTAASTSAPVAGSISATLGSTSSSQLFGEGVICDRIGRDEFLPFVQGCDTACFVPSYQ